MIEVNTGSLDKNRSKYYLVMFLSIVAFAVLLSLHFKYENKRNRYDSNVEASNIDVNCSIKNNGDESCSPIYYFNVDGVDYTCKSSNSAKSVDGDLNKVYYMSDSPELCATEFDLEASPLILVGIVISILVFLICLFVVIKSYMVSGRINKLLKKGTLFKGVNYTIEDTNINFSGKHYIRPVVDLPLPNGDVLHLIGDPIPSMKHSSSETVDVLVDLHNPSRYYIDYSIRVSGLVSNEIIDFRKKIDIGLSDKKKNESVIPPSTEPQLDKSDNANLLGKSIENMQKKDAPEDTKKTE